MTTDELVRFFVHIDCDRLIRCNYLCSVPETPWTVRSSDRRQASKRVEHVRYAIGLALALMPEASPILQFRHAKMEVPMADFQWQK